MAWIKIVRKKKFIQEDIPQEDDPNIFYEKVAKKQIKTFMKELNRYPSYINEDVYYYRIVKEPPHEYLWKMVNKKLERKIVVEKELAALRKEIDEIYDIVYFRNIK